MGRCVSQHSMLRKDLGFGSDLVSLDLMLQRYFKMQFHGALVGGSAAGQERTE